ncbi:p450 domain containing protein [Asbolus verrucosus]|uniref:p450 domain containing protein n=1 Tax=Asbolus verrucosus TaxID=1661398 RepID=A0A482W0T2_ASBVE|nr:p450 domain containing protein [Asbolus verrucosus]
MFLTSSLTTDLAVAIFFLTSVVTVFFKRSFQYWSRKHLPHPHPTIPFGNLPNPYKDGESIGVFLAHLYKEMKKVDPKHCGFYAFAKPCYCVFDLDYVKNVLSKDFQYFVDRGIYYNEKDDPISAHLFAIGGRKWQNLRKKLTPTFTSGRMKMMFQSLLKCENSLYEAMEDFCEKSEAVDIKEVLGCFTTDIIGSCAFGLDCNSFKDKESPFPKYGRKIFESTRLRSLLNSFSVSFPNLSRVLKIRQIPKDVGEFFTKIVTESVRYREETSFFRKDFLQLLIELKNARILTIQEIVAQSFVFFAAGFETSSTTMTFALYELAKNQRIQERLREEIEQVLRKHRGEISYESIQEMKYMNQVVDETLRKYPPIPFITRECIRDYKLPAENIIIEKGTSVFIPILGIHHDEEYYPDPEIFDPERFSEDNRRIRHQYAHIPFGQGPRICIGSRFGLMETKIGLTSILKHFKLSVNSKTREPLMMSPQSFILAAVGDVWLNAKKIY